MRVGGTTQLDSMTVTPGTRGSVKASSTWPANGSVTSSTSIAAGRNAQQLRIGAAIARSTYRASDAAWIASITRSGLAASSVLADESG